MCLSAGRKRRKTHGYNFSSIFPNILFALKSSRCIFLYLYLWSTQPPNSIYHLLSQYTHSHTHLYMQINCCCSSRWNTHAGEPPVGFCFCFRRVRDVLFLPTVTANTRNLTATKNTKTKIFRFLFILFYITKKTYNQQQQQILQNEPRKVCLQYFFSSKIAVRSCARYAVTTQTF